MKETIKIKNEYDMWIPLIIASYKKNTKKDGYVGVLIINDNFLIDLV
jgi:hypothetical protein